MLTPDKLTEIFCIADDFCKEFDLEVQKHQVEALDKKKYHRPSRMSDSEIMTILIGFHFGTFRNFKHYYLFYVQKYLTREFPDLVSYNRFVELQSKVFIQFALFLKLICLGKCTGITYVDSTCIRICHNKRIRRNKVFKGLAEIGKSTMGWFFGFKLHLLCNERGELVNFCLTRGNVDDRNQKVFSVLSKGLFGKLYADKGYISASLFEMLFNKGIHLVTGIKKNMKNRLMSVNDKILLRKRSIIETINDELKNICYIEHSRHRSPANFIMNLLAALGAYSFFPKKPSIKFDKEQISR
ncbi:hypothetical protein EZS27_011828 [termite gut metagenome]|uniref:Transposase DDE domain-containing protein n=2 Tax=termite gut metagenome TaxID=433724 RepID=A0A5J4S4P4_9ZZZZ